MRFIDIFLSESAKSELLASKQGPKLLAALKRDRLANQEMTADQLTVELESMDPTNGKMLQWLVNQYAAGIFKLEDAPRVSTALADFNAKKRSLEKKDINQYKRLSDLEDAVEDTKEVSSKKQQKQEIKTQGADTVFESDAYSIVKLKTEEAACAYGKGTRWCTAADKNNMFNQYNAAGPLYVILDHANNRKFQLHFGYDQFMDEQDDPVVLSDLITQYPAILGLIDNEKADLLNDPVDALGYASDVINGRWPAAEPIIANDAFPAFYYAQDVIKGRWPEGEPTIAKKPAVAYKYAMSIIKGRWPEAEPYIARHPLAAYVYAQKVIKGRWPEAEAVIATHANSAMNYAKAVIKGRWPEAEPIIMKDAADASVYAQEVIKGRWPEAEDAIATSRVWWQQYKKMLARS
jgi:hypothetical protein